MRIRTFVIRATVALAAVTAQMAFSQNDWPAYGRDPGAQRYSPLKQINPGNVSKLVQAWSFQTRPSSEAGGKRISSTTPLMHRLNAEPAATSPVPELRGARRSVDAADLLRNGKDDPRFPRCVPSLFNR